MKSTEILIPNYSGREALECCIESIRANTGVEDGPYKIIVYNDGFSDLDYLHRCADRGWVSLIEEADPPESHGGKLNRLLHAYCHADYAVLMDNDVWIKARGWLRGLIRAVEAAPDILGVCNRKPKGYFEEGYRPPQYFAHFMILKMAAYNDGMQVDWGLHHASRLDEPYLSLFADLYPPETNPLFLSMTRALAKDGWSLERFNTIPDQVLFDPGSHLAVKVKCENPKGYRVVDWPPDVVDRFYHWTRASAWLDPENAKPTQSQFVQDQHRQYKAEIVDVLNRLRGQT